MSNFKISGKFIYLPVLLGFFWAPFFMHAQIDNNGCLANRFGIDADLRSGAMLFIGDPEPSGGSDDWFLGPTGRGVIDQTNAAAIQTLLQVPVVSDNLFEARMNSPVFSIVDGTYWVDAVYARDNFGGTGFTDLTAFPVSSKNGQDPAIWGTGPANVLGKNDLIDVAGYMRRQAPPPGFPVPPAPGGNAINYLRGDLWFYGLIIRAEPGGDAYMDFEFFIESLNYNYTTNKFNSGGPDMGHTAFLFTPTGKITRLGDVIFNVSLSGGGTTPNIELRVWMNRALYTAMRTSPASYPDLPFNLAADFDGAGNGSAFGYARITPKTSEQACGKVNVDGQNPTVAPWGHRGTKANLYFNNTQTHALFSVSEVAMDMSIYGIDNSLLDGADLCAFPYQTFIVKTRSSGSFTAALKDFGGPYSWGKPGTVATAGGFLSCTNPTTTVSASPVRADMLYNWTTTNGNIIGPSNTASITVDKPGTYTLLATLPTGCVLPPSNVVVTRVSNEPPFSAATATGNVACTPTSGAVTLTTAGGTAPFTYSWSNGASTQNLTGVGAGSYMVTISDSKGCNTTTSGMVSPSTPMVFTPTVTDVTCSGGRNGAIGLAVSGGLSPYTYLWSTGNTLATLNSISAGSYTVTVTDANGCTKSETFVVMQPSPITAALSKTDDTNNTPGVGTGTITMTGPTGGTPNYSYLWSGPNAFSATTQHLNALDYGLYTVTITDNNGCTFTSTLFIYEPEDCNDGIDNDGDGLTDCLDPDCKPAAPTGITNPPVCLNEEFIQYTATSGYTIPAPSTGQNEFLWSLPPGAAIYDATPPAPYNLLPPPYNNTINVKYTTTQGGFVCVRVRIDTCLSDPFCIEVVCNRAPDLPTLISID